MDGPEEGSGPDTMDESSLVPLLHELALDARLGCSAAAGGINGNGIFGSTLRCLGCLFFLCLDRLAESEKAIPHSGHLNGFSPVWWVRLWTVRLLARENAAPHSWHKNGLSPVCVRICAVKRFKNGKAFPHSLHGNGLSPVWIFLCFVRSLDTANALPQSWHRKGLSPVCFLMWTVRSPA